MLYKIFTNIISLTLVFTFNVYFEILKLFGKKIVVFYFGAIGSFENHDILISEIINKIKKKKFIFFKISEVYNKNTIFNFINMRFIKYLNSANIIITNTVDRNLPSNSTNILIPHDFYDTFSNFKNYQKIGFYKDSKLIQYDFIFCSNVVVKKFYEKKIKQIKKKISLKKYIKKTSAIIMGYYKYDFIQKLINKKIVKNNNKTILLIATSRGVFSNKLMLKKVINKILKDFKNFKLIFRPHPKEQQELIDIIREKYKNNKRISIDLNPIYLNSFIQSNFAIADYTGSAYSYALLTSKPVIFYFNKKLDKDQKDTNFYKDLSNIGTIAENINDIKKKYYQIKKNEKKIKRKIKMFKQRIFPENNKFINNFSNFLENY